MNDEIKEILDNLKEWSVDGNLYFEINDKKAKKLYNYITNLQQENFNLRENILIHKMSFKSDDKSLEHLINMPSYEELQQENERLKEQINQYENPDDMTLFYMWLDAKAKDKMKQFENQIIMLKQQNQIITQLGEDYKSRCEKAIEYIKENCCCGVIEEDNVVAAKVLQDDEIDDLLNILQNGSEENE